uniref:Receptor expression-enhancing protein n=1 Tax=Noctiluca scintillans TaxID=2966 RepID=A0A7S1EY26_NOCSC|mmetsp:Transcript_17319/g.46998  ORF Transcript_17319/g.46998 Transcript_17319/m.46998 type:complete len:146 (+) Transcript_17319:63-500(+)|eukprot:CAMPEP_0194502376 /NCGR_PEP_ID=MMETSP0253-20130528/25538_1 /TAXON_ID=2966 /ORGANISM="Noctiluca scintillans" /LENGTH=145 /DNA_ID=CAMNT_0039344525 /DNA_START=63 /DNA_END=500 /DNA_ORIENTATION=-
MVITILPFGQLLVAAAQWGYPLKRILEKKLRSDDDLTQWVVYAMISVLFMILETHVLFFALDYVPLYLELKLLFVVWLIHPDYQGALYLWHEKIVKVYRPWDEKNYSKIPVFKAAESLKEVEEEVSNMTAELLLKGEQESNAAES